MMHWPWQRRGRESDDTREVRAELEQVRARRPEVERLAAIGRTQQQHNHFGEGIERAMRRRFAS